MRTKTILVPVDFSEVTAKVVDSARELACALDGRIILLHAREYAPPSGEVMPGLTMPGYASPMMVVQPMDFEQQKEALEEIKRDFVASSVDVRTLLVEGPTVPRILRESEALEADLIVMGSHGHGAVYNLLVGSVTEGVLKSAKCPVLVVPSSRS